MYAFTFLPATTRVQISLHQWLNSLRLQVYEVRDAQRTVA